MPASPPKVALVALGTNLPHRGRGGAALLDKALCALEARQLDFIACSNAWESPAWPPSDQPPFVNAVAAFDARDADAQTVLETLLEVEAAFGRERRERWAARTLDLDLIDFAGLAAEAPGLTLPHPRLAARAFVLAPLAEVAPDWRHPVTGEGVAALLARADQAGLKRLGPVVGA